MRKVGYILVVGYLVAVSAVLIIRSEQPDKKKPFVIEEIWIQSESQPSVFKITETKSKKMEDGFERKVFGREVGRRFHIVKPGESIVGLARKFKVHEASLRKWNKLGPDDTIHPGQRLVIKKIRWPKHEAVASWYGPGFHGKTRADGYIYDMKRVLVAHRDLPLNSVVKVTNLNNGKYIVAKVLDRGPYIEGRDLDLSFGAARLLGAVKPGLINVLIEPLGS